MTAGVGAGLRAESGACEKVMIEAGGRREVDGEHSEVTGEGGDRGLGGMTPITSP
jgi:hypothetical protein